MRLNMNHALGLLAKLVSAGDKGYPLDDACRELGLDRGNLGKLVEAVSRCGTPPHGPSDIISVYDDGERLYVDFAEHFRGPLRLSLDEMLALRMALQWWREQQTPWMDELRPLMDKLMQRLDDAEANEADALEDRVLVLTGSVAPRELPTLVDAVRLCQVVTFAYHSQYRDQTGTRKVWPLKVFLNGDAWYLKAFDPQAGGLRRFHTGRMRDVEVLEETFDPDSAPCDDDKAFDWRAQGMTVQLRAAPGSAMLAGEMFPQAKVEPQEDGGALLTLEVFSLPYLRNVVLGFGTGLEIVGPPQAREHMRAYLDACLKSI